MSLPVPDLISADSISEPLWSREGVAVTVRSLVADDASGLQAYVRALSEASRYSRMLGAARELPAGELRRAFETDIDHHSLVLTTVRNGEEHIIGEARLSHDIVADDVEVSLSIADSWQGRGLGRALLDHLQERAARFGTVTMFGDTLRSNAAMIGLARDSGFALMPTPGDWRLVRFYKVVGRDAAQLHSILGSSLQQDHARAF